MKHSRNVTILVALLCVSLAHHIDGLPQVGRNCSHSRPNAYNNRWQQNIQTSQTNWQSNGGWNWLLANNSDSQISNRNNYNSNSLPRRNDTRQLLGTNYQRRGERLWLNNNESHPYIQVPGFGNRSSPAAAKQSNSSVSLGTSCTAGWRAPYQELINNNRSSSQKYDNWAPFHRNLAQDISTTRQPIRSSNHQGGPATAGTWDIGRSKYNSTSGGQIFGVSWHVPGSPLSPSSGFIAPANPHISANWKSGAGNNSYPFGNSRAPSNTQLIGNNGNAQNATFGKGGTGPINSGYPGAVALGNGHNSQSPHSGFIGSSSYGTPLAPLAGGGSWDSNALLANVSYPNGQRQPH
ncbi:uncharacterized protein MAL13P1.336-like [Anastrepha ludens]|uniref:uncharacterized protein MAL13P1.336-like n=1 Tax=Anastrepha ludens TaxID=28586 RepID=UPI0023B171D4|nr:uncharacterized protein MAL13P1.336-like [Anastrepha ludens]